MIIPPDISIPKCRWRTQNVCWCYHKKGLQDLTHLNPDNRPTCNKGSLPFFWSWRIIWVHSTLNCFNFVILLYCVLSYWLTARGMTITNLSSTNISASLNLSSRNSEYYRILLCSWSLNPFSFVRCWYVLGYLVNCMEELCTSLTKIDPHIFEVFASVADVVVPISNFRSTSLFTRSLSK